MPKKARELSAKEVRDLSQPGFYSVGGVAGLHLQIKTENAKSWILRVKIGSKRRDVGLGGFPDVTLAQAREKAREYKEQIRQGIDPVQERLNARSRLVAAQAKAVTFEDLAAGYIVRKQAEFKSPKQAYKVEQQVKTYVLPYLGKMAVTDIEMSHIVQMLEPIWSTKTETATRVRLHAEKILDIAIANKVRAGENPAKWKGMLEHSTLPKASKVSKVQHLAALPVDEMPGYWQKLKGGEGMSVKAVQFIILTACRSGEARGATWDEIDLQRKIWTIPAEKMKAGKKHEIPLTPELVELLESLPRLSEYVFPGGNGGSLSDVAVSKACKKYRDGITVHGFRSCFKDWARQHTAYADEVSELQLAHVSSDATRAAYARDALLNKRRALMTEWARYCEHGHPEKKRASLSHIGEARA